MNVRGVSCGWPRAVEVNFLNHFKKMSREHVKFISFPNFVMASYLVVLEGFVRVALCAFDRYAKYFDLEVASG